MIQEEEFWSGCLAAFRSQDDRGSDFLAVREDNLKVRRDGKEELRFHNGPVQEVAVGGDRMVHLHKGVRPGGREGGGVYILRRRMRGPHSGAHSAAVAGRTEHAGQRSPRLPEL